MIGQIIIRIVGCGPTIERADDLPIELLVIVVADAAGVIGEPAVVPGRWSYRWKWISPSRIGIDRRSS